MNVSTIERLVFSVEYLAVEVAETHGIEILSFILSKYGKVTLMVWLLPCTAKSIPNSFSI